MATCEEVEQLKKANILELPWKYLDKKDNLSLYEINSCICAAMRVSKDPYDTNLIWIDDFEIVRNYRNQGIGKLIICNFLEECELVVNLMAKNESVAEFWYKCGFQYDNPSKWEIPMIFSKQS